MKRKLHTLLVLMFVTGATQAQFLPFNKVIDFNLVRPVDPVLMTADTTANGNSKFYQSPYRTNDAGRFFPNITDNSYKLRALCSTTDGKFELSGGKLSVSNSTDKIAKIGAYDIANAAAVVKIKFTLDLTNYAGKNWLVIAFGNAGTGWSQLMENSTPFAAASANTFGAFRVLLNGGVFKTQYRNAAGDNNVDVTSSLITPSASNQVIEIFANSSSAAASYTYNSASVALASNTYHVYVNGAKYTEVFPKVGTLYVETVINAFSLTFAGSVNPETFVISDMQVTYPAASLPVSLTSFTGEKAVNGIRLNWKTSSELNNDHFDILRSTTGDNFTTLTSIAGRGTSNEVNTYSYVDNAPEAGVNYYKLKQVDKDGTETVSDIVVAVKSELNESDVFTANIYEGKLTGSFNSLESGTVSISLTDLSGRKVFEKSIVATVGLNDITLAIPPLNSGIYVTTLIQNGKSKSIKIMK